MSKFHDNSWVITRKEHKCYLCKRKFPPNSLLLKWVNKEDGDFWHGYECFACLAFKFVLIDRYDYTYEEIAYHFEENDVVSNVEWQHLTEFTWEEGLTHYLSSIRAHVRLAVDRMDRANIVY